MCFWNKDKPRTLYRNAHYLMSGLRYFTINATEPSIFELTVTTKGGACSLEARNKDTNEIIFFEESIPTKVVEVKLAPGKYIFCLRSKHHNGTYQVRLKKENQ